MAPATVVVQYVKVRESAFRDFLGNNTPYTETVGSGKAKVLRDGRAYDVNWKREDGHATARRSPPATAQPVNFAKGQVWVVFAKATPDRPRTARARSAAGATRDSPGLRSPSAASATRRIRSKNTVCSSAESGARKTWFIRAVRTVSLRWVRTPLVREAQQEAAAVLRVADLVEQPAAAEPADHLGDGGPVEPHPLPHRALVQAGLGDERVEDGELGRGDLLGDHRVPQQVVRLLEPPGQVPGVGGEVHRRHVHPWSFSSVH